MKNLPKQILFPMLSGIVLLLASCIPISYAQANTVDFGGTWNTVTSNGKKFVITLQSVRRTSVTGTYTRNGLTASYKPADGSVNAFVKVSAVSGEPALQNVSSITGTVTDNVLRFKWLEDGGRGAGRFTMSPDGQSFQGTFSLTDNPDDTSGGTWNGTRTPYFAGAWRGKLGEGVMEIIFQQNGSQVTGLIKVNSADLGVIKEGYINVDTLRFQLWRPSGRISPNGMNVPEYAGTGELVMNKDGKSFSGKILNAPANGALIARPGRS
jgi:hypothetical protein